MKLPIVFFSGRAVYPRHHPHKASLAEPDLSAVCSWGRDLTRGEFGRLSWKLTRHLVDLSARADLFVPISLEWLFWIVMSILAVVKTGATFVLLDSSTTPPQRLREICQDVEARIVIISARNTNRIVIIAVQTIEVDDPTRTAAVFIDYHPWLRHLRGHWAAGPRELEGCHPGSSGESQHPGKRFYSARQTLHRPFGTRSIRRFWSSKQTASWHLMRDPSAAATPLYRPHPARPIFRPTLISETSLFTSVFTPNTMGSPCTPATSFGRVRPPDDGLGIGTRHQPHPQHPIDAYLAPCR